ncbi:MAG: hypothetical protein JW902_17205 [Syntrophaceae bacterium]|nr:hypothetical protein [Syntrophaceae bacterium]
MNKILTEKQIQKLGLSNYLEITDESFTWPQEDIGEGKGEIAAIFLTLANIVTSTVFVPVGLPSIESRSIRVEAALGHPGVIRLSMPKGNPIREVRGLSDNSVVHDKDDPCTVCLAINEKMPAVALTEREGLVLTSEGETIHVIPVLPRIAVEPFSKIESPVGNWIISINDSWLVDEIQRNIDQNDAWCSAVATGLYARFIETPSLSDFVDQTLAGRPNEQLVLPRIWARNLSEADCRTIEDLGFAEVDLLSHKVEDLELRLDPEDKIWRGDLLELCERRDDLEGVRILLNETGKADRLSSTIEDLDEEAQLFISSMPVSVRLDNERLARVAKIDPAAWWASLAAEEMRL